jgi:cytochrome c biogenesis protein CcmG/thiol:disulfide interchange protein DsbE
MRMRRNAMPWYPFVLVALLLTCGASAAPRPTAAAAVPSFAAPACPAATGAPIAGVRHTVLPCLDGSGAVTVSTGYGRPEVINLWASWCGPCRTESDLLESAHRRAGDRVFFLGVDTRDERSAALRFLGAAGVTYPQVLDPGATLARAEGVPGLPYTLVVDAGGRVVWRHVGVLTAPALRGGLALAGVTLPG